MSIQQNKLFILIFIFLFSFFMGCKDLARNNPVDPKSPLYSRPASPINLTASIDMDIIQATISWQANTETNLAKYRLYRSQDNINYTIIKDIPKEKLSYDDIEVKKSQTYYYKITAFNINNVESEKSASIKVILEEEVIIILPPVNFKAIPKNTEITLQWEEVSPNPYVIGYRIQKSEDNINYQYLMKEDILNQNIRTIDDISVDNDKPYYYKICSVRDGEKESDWTNSIIAIPEEFEPNNSKDTAQQIDLNKTHYNFICPGDDIDYFYFSIPTERLSAICFSLTSDNIQNYDLGIETNQGEILAPQNKEDAKSKIIFLSLDQLNTQIDNHKYLRVFSNNQNYSISPYSLQIIGILQEIEPNDNPPLYEQKLPNSEIIMLTGTMSSATDKDFYLIKKPTDMKKFNVFLRLDNIKSSNYVLEVCGENANNVIASDKTNNKTKQIKYTNCQTDGYLRYHFKITSSVYNSEDAKSPYILIFYWEK